MDYNTDFTWSLSGSEPDVFEIALHEFGHALNLQDDPSYTWLGDEESVMWYSGGKRNLYMDDKEGAAMMYGIQTEFEQSEFLGLYQAPNWNAVAYNASSYSFGNCSLGRPDYWTYGKNVDGIPTSPSGERVMRFRGCTQPNGSDPNYAYMTIAQAEHHDDYWNSDCAEKCYLTIRDGMKLTWEQYNSPGLMCTVSLDLEFSDGTSLRDSNLTDNYNDNVHPSSRNCFSGWRSFEIDLSPLANGNRKITRYMVAFDNPSANGQWRSYFDDIDIIN